MGLVAPFFFKKDLKFYEDSIGIIGNGTALKVTEIVGANKQTDKLYVVYIKRYYNIPTALFNIRIGLTYQNGSWAWTDGTPFDFSLWGPGQPQTLTATSAGISSGPSSQNGLDNGWDSDCSLCGWSICMKDA